MVTPVLNNDPHNVHPQNSSSDIEYWVWRSRAKHPQNSLTLFKPILCTHNNNQQTSYNAQRKANNYK